MNFKVFRGEYFGCAELGFEAQANMGSEKLDRAKKIIDACRAVSFDFDQRMFEQGRMRT